MEAKQQQQQHDRVVFENVADQYVKGEDVKAFFTVFQGINVNPNEDQIGLLRVGCTNIKECLTYSLVQFNSSIISESIRHGTATFSSSSLSANDDEFYQFCYINNKRKNLGSSIPFQLNCTLDYIDLLSNTSIERTKTDEVFALSDHDNDDILIIHSKRNGTENKLHHENRSLLNMNDQFDDNNIQANEYNMYRSLSEQYQNECSEYAERCRTLEAAQTKNIDETKRIRSQLNTTYQLVIEQATQVVDLERRLMQANDLIKKTNQEKLVLEQKLNDTNLTYEKYQRSMQGQLNATIQLTKEQAIHILDLEHRLKPSNESLNHEKMLLEQQLRDLRLISEKYQISTQGQLNKYQEQIFIQQEQIKVLERSNTLLCEEINEENPNQKAYINLQNSYKEIEKRCIKHQKGEIDLKRQLKIYENSVNDLQSEVQDLTKRLTAGAEEYKTLFHKYNAPEHKKTTVSFDNTYENCQEQESISKSNSSNKAEIQECPMCNMEFSQDFTLEKKHEHIEGHFQ